MSVDWTMAVFALACAKHIWAQQIKSIKQSISQKEFENRSWIPCGGKVKMFVFFLLLKFYKRNKTCFVFLLAYANLGDVCENSWPFTIGLELALIISRVIPTVFSVCISLCNRSKHLLLLKCRGVTITLIARSLFLLTVFF